MEKQNRCKICYRKFPNGRSLGGHMKSHFIHPRPPPRPPVLPPSSPPSSSGSEPEEGEINKVIRKSSSSNNVKLVDTWSSYVTLQDRESETESCKYVTRRRSKRTRKPTSSTLQFHHSNKFLPCDDDISSYYCNNDMGSGSSISDVTSEEDVAFCLMMMSRDTWSYTGSRSGSENHNVDDEVVAVAPQRKRYKCETCNKVFRSYQALGGHRASHKKTRVMIFGHAHDTNNNNQETVVHKCPVCYRVFASGQALGGHKRSHVSGNQMKSEVIVQSRKMMKKKTIIGENFIDLNLPAPMDEDEDEDIDEENVSQIATSSVSDVHL